MPINSRVSQKLGSPRLVRHSQNENQNENLNEGRLYSYMFSFYAVHTAAGTDGSEVSQTLESHEWCVHARRNSYRDPSSLRGHHVPSCGVGGGGLGAAGSAQHVQEKRAQARAGAG